MATKRARQHGFSMLELVVVMVILAMFMAMALPNMWPAIAFTGLEGQAQYVSNYGRESTAHCMLMRERFIVKIDFDEQRMWAERVSSPADLLEKSGGDAEAAEEFDPYADLESVDPVERAIQMGQHMEVFKRTSLEVLADNAKHSDLGLDEVGPEFKDIEFDQDADETEIVYDPLLLEPHLFPDDVVIDTVIIGQERTTTGVAEIEILPLGLTGDVTFFIKQTETDEFMTVVWDAITGGSRIYPGKEDPSPETDK